MFCPQVELQKIFCTYCAGGIAPRMSLISSLVSKVDEIKVSGCVKCARNPRVVFVFLENIEAALHQKGIKDCQQLVGALPRSALFWAGGERRAKLAERKPKQARKSEIRGLHAAYTI